MKRLSCLVILILALSSCSPAGFPMPTLTSAPMALPSTMTQSPLSLYTPVASTIPPAPTSTPLPPTKLGVHLLLDDGRNAWPMSIWPTHLRYARQAVGEWGYVTELIRLDDLNAARWQVFMDLCAELHLTPILRLATTYDRAAGWWTAPPADPDGRYRTIAARYTEFVTALRWPTTGHTIVVGNEPNHGDEWGGRPDPVAYARFLMDVADTLHAADEGARVLNAGLDPYTPNTGSAPFINGMYYLDEEAFLDRMHEAYPDVFTHIDAWASHAYPLGPLTEGPWQQVYQVDWINDASNPNHIESPPGIYNRGINGYQWELFKLSTYNVSSLPVMITETGWRHAETTDPAATDNGRPLPEAATVAQYLNLALHGNHGRYPNLPEDGWTPWLADPQVVAVTPFALDGLPAEWGHTNWLALNPQGQVLYTYAPFDLLVTGNTQP